MALEINNCSTDVRAVLEVEVEAQPVIKSRAVIQMQKRDMKTESFKWPDKERWRKLPFWGREVTGVIYFLRNVKNCWTN